MPGDPVEWQTSPGYDQPAENRGTPDLLNVLGLLIPLAALTSAGLIVLLRPVLVRYALARPNSRSSHVSPTPQGAGVAVIGATLFGLGVFAAMVGPSEGLGAWDLWPLVIGVVLLAIVGAVDDIVGMDVLPRLAAQMLAAGLTVGMLPDDIRALPFLPFAVERIVEVLGLVWFVNLFNFMDGIDWMTVAETVPITVGLLLYGLLGALPQFGMVVSITLLGAVLGFAPFNKPVARVFLGDVGSLPLGLLVGWMLILVAGHGYFVAALLLPLYYLADSTITLFRRLAERQRIWQSHRCHYYQLATENGFQVKEIVARVFLINIALMIMGAVSVYFASPELDVLLFIVGICAVWWLLSTFVRRKSCSAS